MSIKIRFLFRLIIRNDLTSLLFLYNITENKGVSMFFNIAGPKENPIRYLNISLFFEMQVYLVPFSLLFYYQNGLTVQDFFLFQSIFFFCCLFLEIPTGYMADLVSRKYIIFLAYLFNCIRLFLFLQFSGYFIVLVGEICYACCKSFLSGSLDSYVYDWLQEKNIPHKMLSKYGKVSSMLSFGAAFATSTSALVYYLGGIKALLIIELITSMTGLSIILFLPNIKIYKKRKIRCQEILNSLSFIKENHTLFLLILFAGVCFATTSIFTTLFQPMMQQMAVPAICFSFVYFFNNFTRGIISQSIRFVKRYFTFKWILFCTTGLIFISFLGYYVELLYQIKMILLLSLLIACISIAFHLLTQIFTLSYLHTIAPNSLRSTCSSVMNMGLRAMSGFSLFLFKDISSFFGYPNTCLIFGILFFIILLYLGLKLTQKFSPCRIFYDNFSG